MLSYQPAGGRSSKASSKALGPITCLDFNAEGSKHVDTPTCSRTSILFPSWHGGRDWGINQPVTSFDLYSSTSVSAPLSLLPPRGIRDESDTYIVVVSAWANPFNEEGSHLLNGRKWTDRHSWYSQTLCCYTRTLYFFVFPKIVEQFRTVPCTLFPTYSFSSWREE